MNEPSELAKKLANEIGDRIWKNMKGFGIAVREREEGKRRIAVCISEAGLADLEERAAEAESGQELFATVSALLMGTYRAGESVTECVERIVHEREDLEARLAAAERERDEALKKWGEAAERSRDYLNRGMKRIWECKAIDTLSAALDEKGEKDEESDPV